MTPSASVCSDDAAGSVCTGDDEEMLYQAHLVDLDDVVDAVPAPKGFKALLANKKFKYLVALIIILIVAIVVPVVLTAEGDVTVEIVQCGSREIKQANYRGNVAVTITGKTCQRWDVQTPHRHDLDPFVTNRETELEENYCRNPDGGKFMVSQ